MTESRRRRAFELRRTAAKLAHRRPHPDHVANGDEARFAAAHYAMSFSKGLAHDAVTGLVADPADFRAFRQAIDGGFARPAAADVPVPAPCAAARRRRWEASAGAAFELQGPDPQVVTLPPAPALGSDELAYEMAEVYELALLRDEPLADFAADSGNARIAASLGRLNALAYDPRRGGRPRRTDADGSIGLQTAFRGSSPGVETGPYLSQLLLVGTADPPGKTTVADGLIAYGAQRIDQRVPMAVKGADYMVEWDEWLRVQNGEDVEIDRALFANSTRRFIATPRDLATYVHYDAPAQAYLNAALILLGMRTPFDPGLMGLGGRGGPVDADGSGPQVLALVAEVAAHALRAVRFQSFNTHLRLRPEALAARIEKAEAIGAAFPEAGPQFAALAAGIAPTLDEIRGKTDGTALLPMAYQEGSPMHPSYGAGHAAVAGACVTVLKAFFDTEAALVRRGGEMAGDLFDRFDPATDTPLAFVPEPDGSALAALADAPLLTLEGELNKLAANVALARNMAGVHFFSDYYDSLRLGEAVALGVLEEQALCQQPGAFAPTVPTFGGATVRIGGDGDSY